MLAAGHKLKRPCCSAMWCGVLLYAVASGKSEKPWGPSGKYWKSGGSWHCRVYIFISFVFIAKVWFRPEAVAMPVGCVISATRVISKAGCQCRWPIFINKTEFHITDCLRFNPVKLKFLICLMFFGRTYFKWETL